MRIENKKADLSFLGHAQLHPNHYWGVSELTVNLLGLVYSDSFPNYLLTIHRVSFAKVSSLLQMHF